MMVDLPEQEFDPEKYHQLPVKDPSTEVFNTFAVPRRYSYPFFLNATPQCIVVVADDQVTKEKVVIKKIQQVFAHPTSVKRAYREFELLKSVRHPNIIHLLNAFSPQGSVETLRDMYLVTEFMGQNLEHVINKRRLDHKLLSFLLYQILCGVRYLHSSGIIHTDLKPSNITVNDRCVLKLIGLERAKFRGEDMTVDADLGKWNYCAPENLLDLPYTEIGDIWSIACIFAEMIRNQVLFPGRDRVEQMVQIVRIMGPQPDNFIALLPDYLAVYIRSLPSRSRPFDEIIPNGAFLVETEYERAHLTANNARDLLSKMLKIDPEERLAAEGCLRHPYVRLWFQEEEVNVTPWENRNDPAMDNMERPLSEWKELLFNEIKSCENAYDVFGAM